MAKTKAKARSKSKTKAKTSKSAAARKPVRPAAKKKAKAVAKKSVGKAVSRRVAKTMKKSPAVKSASPELLAIGKVFDRVKALLRKPLDPRVRSLVDALSVDGVVLLMNIARKKDDAAAHREELVQTLNEWAGRPAPLPHGSWIWHELMTTDVEGSQHFYRELLGWQPQVMEMMPGFNYTTFANNGVDLAGMMAISPEHGEMTSTWGVYVKVDDVDVAAEKAEMLGGEIVVPAHDIPVGRWAMVKDPGGATICLYRSRV